MADFCNGSASRAVRRALVGAVATLALVCAAGASASVTGTKSEFHCPLTAEFKSNANIFFCLHSEVVGGQLAIGGLAVPIANVPVTADLSFDTNIEVEGSFLIHNPASGQVVGTVAQNVPGGLLGIVGSTVSGQSNSVTANIETVGSHTPSAVLAPLAQAAVSSLNLIFQESTALLLPVRIHLHNPFLGAECFIGSSSSPIELRLTTGPATSPPPARRIVGTAGRLSFLNEFNTIVLTGATLVGNSFSVPMANGCGASQSVLGHSTSGLLDGAINHKLGLPSPAGRNAAILNANIELDVHTLLEQAG